MLSEHEARPTLAEYGWVPNRPQPPPRVATDPARRQLATPCEVLAPAQRTALQARRPLCLPCARANLGGWFYYYSEARAHKLDAHLAMEEDDEDFGAPSTLPSRPRAPRVC